MGGEGRSLGWGWVETASSGIHATWKQKDGYFRRGKESSGGEETTGEDGRGGSGKKLPKHNDKCKKMPKRNLSHFILT